MPLARRLWTSIFTSLAFVDFTCEVERRSSVLMHCSEEEVKFLTQCLILGTHYTVILIITALVRGKKAHDLFSSNFLSLMKWFVFLTQTATVACASVEWPVSGTIPCGSISFLQCLQEGSQPESQIRADSRHRQ